MPKNIREILKEYDQKLEESLTFGVSINEDLNDFLNPQAKAAKTKAPGLKPKDDETGASSAGRGDFLVQNIKSNLRSLGFTVDDLDKQKTIAQLIPAPFGFKFSLLWPKENEWGEKSYVTLRINGKEIDGNRIDTRAQVKNPDLKGKLLLSTKLGLDIIFVDPSELARTLGGGEGKLPPGKKGKNYRRLLEEGVTYKVQINSDVVVGGEGTEEGGVEEPIKEVPIPEEITSGKNRNEIFRLLLKGFGRYSGPVVYGDGFTSIEDAREYARLQRGLKSGKNTKEELVDFRKNAGRDAYSMMIANLRKSYPTNFFKALTKAFPEFNIQYTKQSVEESYNLSEEDGDEDKYKRWNLVFPGKIIGTKTIDNLDQNIREFMIAVKKWFAVPVTGVDGKKRSYTINYDEDKVNQYWETFYGNKKNESKLSLSKILKEMLSEEQVINNKTPKFPEYFLLKIENGGLQTIDEGREESESRVQKAGGEKKEGFIDAILVKAASLFNQKTGRVEGKKLSLKPGYANLGDFATDKEGFADIDIEYNDKGLVTKGVIEIKNNPKNINALLEQAIKSGNMRVKKSDKHNDYIVFYYPATDIGKKINNTWGEILS
jgi:hypothetical protein